MASTAKGLDSDFWKGKRVLVTGHTGFMGAWLALWLTELGSEVHGVALDPIVSPNLFADLGLKIAADHRTDIRSMSELREIFGRTQPEIVFHLAAQALVLPSYQNPVETFATNILGTAHVLELARESRFVRSVAVVTSDKCYENKELKKPFVESDPMGGDDPYSASKGAAELIVSSYRESFYKQTNAALLSFRAGNIIGGGDWSSPRLFPDLMRTLAKGDKMGLRHPQAVRPWQFVLEPLYVYLLLVQKSCQDPKNKNLWGQPWNIGPDTQFERSVLDVVKLACNYWGSKDQCEIQSNENSPHEAQFLKISSEKLKSLLGWKPVLGFEQSVRWSVEWYKDYFDKLSPRSSCENQIEEFSNLTHRMEV